MGTPTVTKSPGIAPSSDIGATTALPRPVVAVPDDISDPGPQWLPRLLEDKSSVSSPHDASPVRNRANTPRRIHDLAEILASPQLLNALTHSPESIHPSLEASFRSLKSALTENVDLASYLVEQESRLAVQRSNTQAQLLSTHALERQWRQKQSDMDRALAPFSPASLYQRLGQGAQEQGMVCQALEDSFLEGDSGPSMAGERDVLDWVRRYRDVKTQFYLRRERKERWDEGRVGGWR